MMGWKCDKIMLKIRSKMHYLGVVRAPHSCSSSIVISAKPDLKFGDLEI